MSRWNRSVSLTQVPESLRLMIRAEKSVEHHLGSCMMRLSQTLILARWAGLVMGCQSSSTPVTLAYWNPKRTDSHKKASTSLLLPRLKTSVPKTWMHCRDVCGYLRTFDVEQLECGEQKTLNLLKCLAPDELDQAAVYLAYGFFMDKGKPRSFHDVKKEDKLAVFTEPVHLLFLFSWSKCRLLLLIQFYRHNLVQPDYSPYGRAVLILHLKPAGDQYQCLISLSELRCFFSCLWDMALNSCPSLPAFAYVAALFSKPDKRVFFAQPVFIIHGEDTLHQL